MIKLFHFSGVETVGRYIVKNMCSLVVKVRKYVLIGVFSSHAMNKSEGK